MIFNRVDKRFTHAVDQERGPRPPSVEMLHSPTNAKTGNRNGHFDYTDSVGCRSVACRHHVSGTHTLKGWIAAKSNATVTF